MSNNSIKISGKKAVSGGYPFKKIVDENGKIRVVPLIGEKIWSEGIKQKTGALPTKTTMQIAANMNAYFNAVEDNKGLSL